VKAEYVKPPTLHSLNESDPMNMKVTTIGPVVWIKSSMNFGKSNRR